MEGERNFKQHLQAPDVSNHVISVNVDSQIAYKMPDLGHLLRMGNGIAMQKGETSIAAEVFHNFTLMQREGAMNF